MVACKMRSSINVRFLLQKYKKSAIGTVIFLLVFAHFVEESPNDLVFLAHNQEVPIFFVLLLSHIAFVLILGLVDSVLQPESSDFQTLPLCLSFCTTFRKRKLFHISWLIDYLNGSAELPLFNLFGSQCIEVVA